MIHRRPRRRPSLSDVKAELDALGLGERPGPADEPLDPDDDSGTGSRVPLRPPDQSGSGAVALNPDDEKGR
jgi:hypothetical protein